MKKRLLTVGCSFTKDNYQKTWADYLAEEIDYDLTNIAARGAGIDFVTNRTLHECLRQSYDLIVIMLPSVDRMDLYVDSQHPLKNEFLDIASWQDGTEPSFVTIDGQLSKDHGYAMSGGEIRGYKKYWFKYYYNETSALLSYWTKVFYLENFFINHNLNYKFTMAYDRHNLVEQSVNDSGDDRAHEFLWKNIKWQNFIFYQTTNGFLSFVNDNQYTTVKHYPETAAHLAWVKHILLPNLSI